LTPFQQLVRTIHSTQKLYEFPKGWRFLYTPQQTLTQNNGLLILGLNPGGDPHEYDPIESVEEGNAFLVEDWNSNFQKKVGQLMMRVAEAIDIDFEDLMNHSCTSNLIPFRSKNWESLHRKDMLLIFAKHFWSIALLEIKPKVILCMGENVSKVIRDLYYPGCETFEIETEKEGRQRVTLTKIDEVNIITIPHLAHWASYCDDTKLVKLVVKGMQNLPAAQEKAAL
jgi:hypothetical protein